MFRYPKKHPGEPPRGGGNIRVIKKTAPGVCGGTDATQDDSAPKTILSDDLILFDVTSSLSSYSIPEADPRKRLVYLSAFAAPANGDTFLVLESAFGDRRFDGTQTSVALVKGNVLPELDRLVKECDLAKNNGYHSKTHGLPENFGGRVTVNYGSGERISYSDNQHPILPYETAARIYAAFLRLLEGQRVQAPDLSTLTEIRYNEERKNGGYTRARMTVAEDGSAVNCKTTKFDDPTVYNSEKPVDAQTVEEIKRVIERCGMLYWTHLPGSSFGASSEKTLTFIFRDGASFNVRNDRALPYSISGGFFKIELELTSKH